MCLFALNLKLTIKKCGVDSPNSFSSQATNESNEHDEIIGGSNLILEKTEKSNSFTSILIDDFNPFSAGKIKKLNFRESNNSTNFKHT